MAARTTSGVGQRDRTQHVTLCLPERRGAVRTARSLAAALAKFGQCLGEDRGTVLVATAFLDVREV